MTTYCRKDAIAKILKVNLENGIENAEIVAEEHIKNDEHGYEKRMDKYFDCKTSLILNQSLYFLHHETYLSEIGLADLKVK